MTWSDVAPFPSTGALSSDWRGVSHESTVIAPLTERRWPHRALFGVLLGGTTLLYLVGLSVSGWANQYYAAAAQAGSESWKAWLFGALDSANFITVDKPPASLWIMGLSVRLFGLNSWSVLVPQALEGIAAVALLYAAVRRVSGRTAGLLAGAVLATTPVATLMFRFDNPDALLVLLLTAAAYATVRAVEVASARWLALAGALVGFGFLTKMLQAFLVLPALALAYLIAAPTPLRRRVWHVLTAGLTLLISAGWWVALVQLWPAASRPYIGGSTDNSVLQLVFGYNGVGRLTGADNNGTPGGGAGGGFSSGQTGLLRLFGSEMGSQISWLLPAALVALGVVAWRSRQRRRTDSLRASLIVWGGWLLVTGILFSFASGIIHPYYTVALAPAIAALVGIGVMESWRARSKPAARGALVAMVASTTIWTDALLGRAEWHPELRWLVALLGGLAALAVWFAHRLRAAVVAPVLTLALLLAPTAYSLQTAATSHEGALPTAGPMDVGFGGGLLTRPTGGFSGGPPPFGFGRSGRLPAGLPNRLNSGLPARGGAPGGLGGASSVSTALRAALRKDAGNYRWAAATTSSNEAASLELATGRAVMALGGFNGTDPAITLVNFQKLVANGEVHYYVADGQGFIGSTSAGGSDAYRIQQWVEHHFTARTIGGRAVYDLSSRE